MSESSKTGSPLRIAVVGAAGRMGRLLIETAAADGRFHVGGCLESAQNPSAGRKIALADGKEIAIVSDAREAIAGSDVVIDFSLPAGTKSALPVAARLGVPFMTGTTGLSEADFAALRDASANIPVLYAANMSLGIVILHRLIRQTLALLPANYTVEIVERHHRFKRDAPSGTAIALAETVRTVRPADGVTAWECGRPHGSVPRRDEDVVIHAVRGGGIIGEHHVQFLGDSEEIVISHRAFDRSVFVRGALEAALLLVERSAGYYSLDDIIAIGERS